MATGVPFLLFLLSPPVPGHMEPTKSKKGIHVGITAFGLSITEISEREKKGPLEVLRPLEVLEKLSARIIRPKKQREPSLPSPVALHFGNRSQKGFFETPGQKVPP